MSPSPLFGELILELGLVTPSQLEEALALQRLTGQRLGEALVSIGYLTRDQLREALLAAVGLQDGHGNERRPLGAILVGLKHISPADLEKALELQKAENRKLGEVLVAHGFCSYRAVYEALSIQQQAGKEPKPPAEPAPSPDRALSVMVVDDSPIACALIAQGLSERGFQVHAYEDPYQALTAVSAVRPAIVLSDWEMPGMDGAELCRNLKSGDVAVPVIILTANDEDTQRVRGLRAGADDYVNKDASMDELAARIDGIVRRTSETERIRKLFARYTSDAVVNEILKSGDVVLTGEKREVTVLFADIRNFTAFADRLSPEQVMIVLNEVLGRLSNAVLTWGGTLDKFLGDGLMAVFGAPVSHTDDAARALQCAQMMMAALADLRRQEAADFQEGKLSEAPTPLALGIGINSGMAIAGNLGSQQRTEYTVIGDPVNVAARLCALAGPGEILVGERTHQLLGKSAFRFEALPPAQVKGKPKPIPLFRALGD